MIIPSRWFTGGRGLDDFRNEMLNDNCIRTIHDFIDASDCFPGVEIKGGVCYFLWDRNTRGLCKVITHKSGEVAVASERPLLESGTETFIRYNELISILKKTQTKKEKPFSDIVSANDPFGFDVRVTDSYKRVKPSYTLSSSAGSTRFYYNGWKRDGVGYVEKNSIRKGNELLDSFKIYIPKAWGVGNPTTDWLNPFVGEPNSCCTETYLLIGPFPDKKLPKMLYRIFKLDFFTLWCLLLK